MRRFARWAIQRSWARAVLLAGAGLACAFALGGLGFAATLAVSTSGGGVDTPVPGTTLSSSTSSSTTAPGTTTRSTTTTPGPAAGSRTVPAEPGHANSVSLAPAGGGKATVQWGPSTFTVASQLTADPDPALGVTLTGVRNQLVGVTVVTDGGAPVKTLHAPLGVVFQGSHRGYVPVTTSDGSHFRKLVRLRAPRLAPGQKDGYYLTDGGRIQILTRHLTVFGVLAPENRAKWGDVTVARDTPPKLRLSAAAVKGSSVRFTLSVDEPVALVLSAKAGTGRPVPLSGASTIGTSALGGPATMDKRANITRGGRYAVTIVLARAWQGPLRVVVLAGDSAGNRVTKTVTVGR